MVAAAEYALPQFLVVGQLAVETEAEPLVLLEMMSLEGLRVATVFCATGRISDMTDAGLPGVLPHEPFALLTVLQAKDLTNRPNIVVGIDQLIAFTGKGGKSSRQLPAVLDIQEHSRQQA